ncbi:hypothetical protein [Coxiella-like endosymbiont]|nr:hypothetical protein [Coxiella-like endosymbiont]
MAFDWNIIRPSQIDDYHYQQVIQGYLHSGGVLNQITLAFEALMSVWLN